MSEWEETAKGQRSAPHSSGWRPAGRYVLLKQIVGGPFEGLRPGEATHLSAEEATRLRNVIAPEKKEH